MEMKRALLSSSELIEIAKQSYNQFKHKNYDWRSFYSGFLEAYGAVLRELEKKD